MTDVAVARPAQKRRRVSPLPYLYLLPSLLLFALFVFYPFVKTLITSLYTTDPAGRLVDFVGLSNYIGTFTSKDFAQVMSVTFEFAIKVVAGSIALGVLAAILAHEVTHLKGLFRTVYALPMAVSSACITVICVFILNPTMGILNYLLGTDIRWLKDVKTALNSVAVVTIWMHLGLNYIFTIAALQNVDTSLYEAAAIDGAGLLRKHWHITLPCISPTLFFLLIVNVINSFQSYAQINLMTRGGPGKCTRVFIYQIYLEAFVNGRFGNACAQSVIMFLLLLILTLAQFRLEKKVTY